MAMYKCPTLGDCDRANAGELFEREPGDDLKCPGCSTPLEIQIQQAGTSRLDKRVIMAAVAVAVVVVGAGIGYYYHQSKAIPGDTPVAGTAGGTVSAASQAVVVAAASMAGAASSAVPGGIAPSDAGIRQDRMDGESKLKQGDSSGAESASNQAAAKEMIKVAIAKMSEGKLDEAEKDLDDALARDPKQALGYYNMAILRLKEGRQDDALKQFEASFMNGFTYFDEMDKDPDLDGIRQDPRFTELVKQYRTPSK